MTKRNLPCRPAIDGHAAYRTWIRGVCGAVAHPATFAAIWAQAAEWPHQCIVACITLDLPPGRRAGVTAVIGCTGSQDALRVIAADGSAVHA